MGQKVNKEHGAAEHTDITREIFLPACEGFISAGACTTDGVNYYSLVSGIVGDDEPMVFWTMKVPVDFVSFTSVKAIWCNGTGNMYWQLMATYAACGEAKTTHSDGPGLGVTASGGADEINCQEPENPLTLASLALGDILGLMFYRAGGSEDDTLDATMYLFGLLFTYVANQ